MLIFICPQVYRISASNQHHLAARGIAGRCLVCRHNVPVFASQFYYKTAFIPTSEKKKDALRCAYVTNPEGGSTTAFRRRLFMRATMIVFVQPKTASLFSLQLKRFFRVVWLSQLRAGVFCIISSSLNKFACSSEMCVRCVDTIEPQRQAKSCVIIVCRSVVLLLSVGHHSNRRVFGV